MQGPALQNELSRDMAALLLQSTESQERRLARDGIAYTKEEFLEEYGHQGHDFWANAPVATEHGPPLTAGQQYPVQPRDAAAPQAAATEHRVVAFVLLTVADVDNVKAEEEKIKPPRSLHRLARDTLNNIITAGVNSNIDRNLEQWFPWRSYIACHEKAYEIIGTGVTHAIAEYIPQTRDANRGYQERLDFVIYRTDGTRCRLHPGRQRRQDATLIYY